MVHCMTKLVTMVVTTAIYCKEPNYVSQAMKEKWMIGFSWNKSF